MYRTKEPELEGFILPFAGKLNADNRWIKLAQLIPWGEAEKMYAKNFAKSGMGAPAKSVRVALGALIIKEKLGLTDEETVEQIRENPYLQYFIGFEQYSTERPFDPSMMVHFRKRLSFTDIKTLNDKIIENSINTTKDKQDSDEPPTSTGGNAEPKQGKLIIDATCAPADIRYPTDLNLLNEAREKAEQVIDLLYAPLRHKLVKPRTYRIKARQAFTNAIKKKKPRQHELRKAIGKQIRFLRRDLKIINKLAGKKKQLGLPKKMYEKYLVIQKLYEQQEQMYREHSHRVHQRIVSICQPHIRPIVRGKASAEVEFGAKLSISLMQGMCSVDRLQWEAYNEAEDLIYQIEEYKRRYGYYPESVHADKIYRNHKNLKYCKDHGIRLNGPKLGRPVLSHQKNIKDLQLAAKQAKADERARIPVEGKFGNAKRRYSLGRIMAKLAATAETVIAIIFLIMNLETLLRIFLTLFYELYKKLKDLHKNIQISLKITFDMNFLVFL